MKSDLVEVLEKVIAGEDVEIEWDDNSMIGVVVAANGYPDRYEKGAVLHGLDAVSKEAFVFHAGTKNGTDGEFETNGGRVLPAGAKADSLEEAQKEVYKALEKLQCDGVLPQRHRIQAIAAQKS